MRMASRKLTPEGQFLPRVLLFHFLLALIVCASAVAQDESGVGTITGTILSTKGAAIADARVYITSKDTGKTSLVRTNGSGAFASGDLPAGEYAVRVEARSFIAITRSVTVKADAATTEDLRLFPEPVPGTVPAQSVIEFPQRNLNFLDLLQLEPGVQTSSAGVQLRNLGAVTASENAFSSLSLFSRSGNSTPIEADGIDLTDHTSGSIVQNFPVGAVEEFRFGGLLAPIASQLYSPGTINIVTASGGNDLHGNLFGFYSNGDIVAASLPGGKSNKWGRQQFGGDLGGAVVADKLFFFVAAQRNRQDLWNPVLGAGGFSSLPRSVTTIREPFREIAGTGRLDYVLSERSRAFYRFAYDQSSATAPFASGPSLQPILTRTNTPSHTFGLDLTSDLVVHSFRFQYFKFRNVTADASSQVPSFMPFRPSFSMNIGGGSTSQCSAGALLCVGPSPFANEHNYQSDAQFRYDGSRVRGVHTFHFGASFNRVVVDRFDLLYSAGPALSDQSSVPLPLGTFGSSGLAADPLAYPVQWAFLGNGQGFASEKSALGLPRGGLTDNQLTAYAGDSWKVHENLMVTYGVHWVRDTVPNNSDLPAISQLNAWQPKLGNRVRQPNYNFAPQLGVAWDPSSGGKTTIRGGAGMFYDQSSFMNAYLDRPLRLAQGSYLTTPAACVGGASGRIQWPTALAPNTIVNGAGIANADGTVSPYDPAALHSWCGESMGAAGPLAVALQQAYASATASANTNASFMGKPTSFAGPYQNGLSLMSPDYQTPRTVQFTAGLRHELHPGLIFTGDYWRQVTTRSLLGVDVNHGGAASTFNVANAVADRNAAQLAHGCPAGTNQVSCMVATLGPAGALAAYGAAGIGAPAQVTGGAPCPFCAFPGLHQNLGTNVVDVPEGRSSYSGFLLSLNQEITGFSRDVPHATFRFSYSHSRYVSQGQDAGFSMLATNYDNPDHFTGPAPYDRTQQFSLGAFFDLRHSFQLSFLTRFASPLPVTLRFQQSSGGAEVLVTDTNGDGSTGDIIPGSSVGSYMRSFKGAGLANFIGNYNSTVAGASSPQTPAGNALVTGGVFSQQELQSMGAVLQPLALPVQHVAGLGWYKTFDVRLGWEHHLTDRISIVPNVSAYNLFNFANFDLPGSVQTGVLNFGAGSLNQNSSPVQPQNTAGGNSSFASGRMNRAGFGPGMSASGAPRSLEFGLKISF